MSYLALNLTEAMRAINSTQAELASAAGVNRAQLNRAARGKGTTGAATVQRIAAALPPAQRGAVLAGWLKDQLTPAQLAFVDIQSTAATIAEDDAGFSLPRELDEDTRRILQWIARQALTHSAVRDALKSFRAAADAVIS